MKTDRPLLQQALEALKLLVNRPTEEALDYADNAITAIEKRLAQQEQEQEQEQEPMLAQEPLPIGFIDAVAEAAAILGEIDPAHAPKNMRWPLADELDGFVGMIKAAHNIKEQS